MAEDNLTDIIMSIYNNNVEFLKTQHPKIYEKIQLIEIALETQQYTQKYDLEHKDGYFDVYQHVNANFLYNQDSYIYSQKSINKMTFDEKSDNFKPYQHYKFDEGSAKEFEGIDIMTNAFAGLSPISHNVDKH